MTQKTIKFEFDPDFKGDINAGTNKFYFKDIIDSIINKEQLSEYVPEMLFVSNSEITITFCAIEKEKVK